MSAEPSVAVTNALLPGNALLTVNRLSKSFGGIQALIDVSMSIAKGEIYGLIGPNGAGKTTFFNLLTGIYARDWSNTVFQLRTLKPRAWAKTTT